jgi:hypothetical protein
MSHGFKTIVVISHACFMHVKQNTQAATARERAGKSAYISFSTSLV